MLLGELLRGLLQGVGGSGVVVTGWVDGAAVGVEVDGEVGEGGSSVTRQEGRGRCGIAS
jgi:hypothetical protein